MKKIKKVVGLVVVFLLNFYNICFADVVMDSTNGHPSPLTDGRNMEAEINPMNNIIVGVLVLIIVICVAIIIRRIIKKKKQNADTDK